jgi:hypothetical protein
MRLGAARFVAGETIEECVATLRRLEAAGLHTNTTLLGEHVEDAEATRGIVTAYLAILDRIAIEGLETNVALKLTHLGLDHGETLAAENVERIVAHAADARELHPDRHGGVGTRRPDAPDLPATPRARPRQRRYGPAGVPVPNGRRPPNLLPLRSPTSDSSRERISSPTPSRIPRSGTWTRSSLA